jgi:TPP-dependent pyruvate/acetoin dehydrogenase alpha subunit
VSTPVSQGLAVASLTDLATPFAIPAQVVDGTDVDRVARAVSEAAVRIRAGQGPRFLEMRCVRMATHSNLTREERPAEEVGRFKDSDPLHLYERRLRSEGILDDDEWDRMRAQIAAEITAAEQFVEAAPWPDAEAAVLDA